MFRSIGRMSLPSWIYFTSFIVIFSGIADSESGELKDKNSRSIFRNGPCSYDQFRCSNDQCVSKSQFCNDRNDCGDNSDEKNCKRRECESIQHIGCDYIYNYDHRKCVPQSWICDGYYDCNDGTDERNCVLGENLFNLVTIFTAKQRAVRWMLQSRDNESLSHKWGGEVSKKAVAWYLGDQYNFFNNKTFVSEMAYEISLDLLSRIAGKSLNEVSSTELASYVNAFIVTCVDPRRFYNMDLVSELRNRADALNETHPSVILALCNAGDDITGMDVVKTIQAFWDAHNEYRTDVEALAVLALSCAFKQDQGTIEASEITELTAELKKKQYRNGTVESLKTTALVMQALYASEREADEENFDEEKALKQILRFQKADGSFGNTANTNYVLPVFAYKSLVNISSSHCKSRPIEEKDRLKDMLNLTGKKSKIRISLWIGKNRTLERTITLEVPVNTSFYGILQWAADIDSHYRFEYMMRAKKPYIYSISGIQDDPENNMFWSLHSVGSEPEDMAKPIKKSPADVVPSNGQHMVFWYKCG